MRAGSILLDRARVYSSISSLFSDPESGKFQHLREPDIQHDFIASCKRLDLWRFAEPVIALLNHPDQERIRIEHAQIFGHTLSKETSPYELEFLKSKEVFSLTQGLADISGFYSAFGLLVDVAERADHIAIEAEFLSFLVLKEALAIENNFPNEDAAVCRQAQIDFGRDHFFWWTRSLAECLLRQSGYPFYQSSGEFLKHFLDLEESKSLRQTVT